jgi:iron(III) transport system ATP-binding protein
VKDGTPTPSGTPSPASSPAAGAPSPSLAQSPSAAGAPSLTPSPSPIPAAPGELAVHDLHKRFGSQPVLAGLQLNVPAGSLTAILGESGSGKTTLLRVLAGFERPDRGSVQIGDRTVDDARAHVHPEQRRVGYVPQEGALFPHLTVAANVGFGLPRARRRARVPELLELVGLVQLAERYPHQLSGGQQQRVALARALAIEPEVVLLDEPFAGLDAHMRAAMREEVGAILRAAGTTTLLVTHDQEEALSLADLVAVLREGRIVQHAAPQSLYTQPLDDALARFVGEANVLAGVLHGELVQTPLGTLPARWHGERPPDAAAVTVLVRPEQLRLAPADAPDGLAGRVERVGFHGHDAVAVVRVSDASQTQPFAAARARAREAAPKTTTTPPPSGAANAAPPPLLVRTLGAPPFPPDTPVKVSAQGPVLVWPADAHP